MAKEDGMGHPRRLTRGVRHLCGLLVALSALLAIPPDTIVRASEQTEKIGGLISISELDNMDSLPGGLVPLPDVPIPNDNPMTPEKIRLGKMLFFDTRLSGDNRFSCAWCHNPALAFSDGLPRASGFDNKELGRHSATILNAAYFTTQFWDGRAATLEQQAVMPIINHEEMNLSEKELVKKLQAIPTYQKTFQQVFGEPPSIKGVGLAIAAYERTLVTPDSPFDRYMRGDKKALTNQQKRGLILFVSRAACTRCHNGPLFSDNKFHNITVPQVGPLAEDNGRYDVTKDKKDLRAFKTSSLRNVELSAPYMHNGAFATLKEVIEFYNKGGNEDPNKAPDIFELHLTEEEQTDLIAFLNSLTGWSPDMAMP
jgi:cytochrome c peroxidase